MALLILVCLNPWAGLLGVASLGLVAAYPFMKRITWWPQAWLGLTFNWGKVARWGSPPPMAGRRSGVGSPPACRSTAFPLGNGLSIAAGLLYAGGVLWTLGYDTIYAVQDLEDDALAGVKSSARRLGAGAARRADLLCRQPLPRPCRRRTRRRQPHLLGGRGDLRPAGSRQAQRFRIDDPRGALLLFNSNALAGLTLFLALTAGHITAPGMPALF